MIKQLLTIGCFLIFGNALAQKTHEISQSQHITSLAASLEIFQDTTSKLNYPNVKKCRFTPIDKFTQKINSDYAYWGRITLQSKLSTDERFVLYLGTASYAEVYIEKNNQVTKELTGRLVPLAQKKIKEGRNAPIPLYLPEATDKLPITIYFRLQNVDQRPLMFKPLLYPEIVWQQKFTFRNLTQGIFNALLWTLILYLTSLSILLKQRDYIFAAAYLSFISLYYLSSSGVLTEYVLGNNPKINEYIWPNTLLFSQLFLLLLTRSFLNTRQLMKRWHRVLTIIFVFYLGYGCFNLISIPLFFNIHIFDISMLIIGLPNVAVMLSVAILAIRNSKIKVKIFAWSIIQLAIQFIFYILYVAFNYGSNNGSFLLQLGYATQGIMFTIAFAQRMKLIEAERRKAQAEQIRLIEEHNELLEQKVQTRAQELKEISDEILAQSGGIQKKNEELIQQQQVIENQRDAIEAHNQTLTQSNRLISQSIKAAQHIQQAILPNQRKLDYLLKEHFIIYRPKDMVSGDFYWLHEIDGYTYLATVDCTGHGVPGAFMSMIGNILLDEIIRVKKITDPAQIVQQLHNEVYSTLRQAETNNNYGMDLSLMILKRRDTYAEIRFCGAKHSLHYYNPQSQETGTFKGDRKSLGGHQNDEVCFTTQQLQLPRGTFVYVGSDGMEDQNNIKRRRFSSKKILQTLKDSAHLPLQQQKEILETTFDTFMQGTIQRDDILIICFQV